MYLYKYSGIPLMWTLLPLCAQNVEASDIFPVGVAMITHVVKCYRSAFQSSFLLCVGEKG